MEERESGSTSVSPREISMSWSNDFGENETTSLDFHTLLLSFSLLRSLDHSDVHPFLLQKVGPTRVRGGRRKMDLLGPTVGSDHDENKKPRRSTPLSSVLDRSRYDLSCFLVVISRQRIE